MCLHTNLSLIDISAPLWRQVKPPLRLAWSPGQLLRSAQCECRPFEICVNPNSPQAAIPQCPIPHDSDCSCHNCELHCPEVTDTGSHPSFKTPCVFFEMPLPDCPSWWAHLAAHPCHVQLPNQLCHLHALEALLPGVGRRYWISWVCREKRLCKHSCD